MQNIMKMEIKCAQKNKNQREHENVKLIQAWNCAWVNSLFVPVFNIFEIIYTSQWLRLKLVVNISILLDY